ncbi:DUF4432 domain-containing protein [Rhizobium sp. AC44/96]|uniref:aldose 1-epimerase family protein n=1 Tax=Rhizobium sp. AC44/96 TaxID=1841654 RepID=UPI00080F73F7|nr:aldose 1-epimerase family protein [Rhizobium sp. AC44/96]OCJ14456.1 DUF4432 domain-containing protein [Rhizobium sp. AC44/96]
MVFLYGKERSARDVAARTGSFSQFAGVRMMTLADGLERGIRMLEFRSGTGLRFTVLVDRALDIADCEFQGKAIGWHSPSGFRNAGLHEYEGEGGLGWLRSFSGLMLTCGLDHILFMDEAPADHFVYGPRQTVKNSIHGRVSTIPARLVGYGEEWIDDRCVLWCEGIVSQGAVFGENLELRRRIEVDVGSNEIVLKDRVANKGFYPTPHMYCYHINIGYPVLDDGARYLAPIVETVWAAHSGAEYQKQNVGYRTMPEPQVGFHEQVWQHEMAADVDGRVPVAIVNDAQAIGFCVVSNKDEFPCMFEWQNLQAGQYAIGIEPSTNHVLGAKFARDRNEAMKLEHGEARSYTTRLQILDGESEIRRVENWIAAIQQQPLEDYPEPTGNYRKLR